MRPPIQSVVIDRDLWVNYMSPADRAALWLAEIFLYYPGLICIAAPLWIPLLEARAGR